jgi:hypothetical protein
MPDGDGWTAGPAGTAPATNLQALLESIVQRFSLIGAVVASRTGDVRARVGDGTVDRAADGFAAALAGDGTVLSGLAGAIEGMTLPRYFSQGSLDAYADLPTPGLVALFMRERGDQAKEPSELQMVSDYTVAKEMVAELRAGLARLGIAD